MQHYWVKLPFGTRSIKVCTGCWEVVDYYAEDIILNSGVESGCSPRLQGMHWDTSPQPAPSAVSRATVRNPQPVVEEVPEATQPWD